MALSASDLSYYVPFLEKKLLGKHLSRPSLYAHNALFFHVSGGEGHRLSIILDDNDPRLYISEDDINSRTEETPFFLSLKKELSNAYLTHIEQKGGDRIVSFSLTIINSVYKEEGRTLVFELIPHHSNLLLLNEDGKIVSLYKESPLTNKRPLLKGLLYTLPEKNFLNKEESSFDPIIYSKACQDKEKNVIDCRRKDRFGPLEDSLKRRLKLVTRKIEAIDSDIAKAQSHVNDGDYGALLYTYKDHIDIKKGHIDIDGFSFDVDPHKSLPANAEAFYKRAKKSKNAIAEGENNRKKALGEKQEIETSLLVLANADEDGLEDLLKENIKTKNPKKKSETPKSLGKSLPSYIVAPSGVKIVFGRSSKENDTLTFLLMTSKNHYWLHVMGDSGSHVIIKSDSPSQEDIHLAASIALLLSKKRDGEVMLARRSEVRKGTVSGQAIVKKFETLRLNDVDPRAEKILEGAKKYDF